jgi:hypothetical protein
MLKVLVIDRCEYCDGEAYVFIGQYKDELGEHPIHRPWLVCEGRGEMEKLISLQEFADLLDTATAMEPDWAELGRRKPINQTQDRSCWRRREGDTHSSIPQCQLIGAGKKERRISLVSLPISFL